MKSVWTTKTTANENHVQTYAIERKFDKLINERQLKQQFYELNAQIDGNVTEWSFKTDAEEIAKCLREAFDLQNLSTIEMRAAVAAVAKKNQWKYEVLDEKSLIENLRKVEIIAEQPKISDDKMESETVRFFSP